MSGEIPTDRRSLPGSGSQRTGSCAHSITPPPLPPAPPAPPSAEVLAGVAELLGAIAVDLVATAPGVDLAAATT